MSDESNSKPYDLDERTALFGEAVIDFAKKVPVNPVTSRLIPQLVAAGTSVGANYREADFVLGYSGFSPISPPSSLGISVLSPLLPLRPWVLSHLSFSGILDNA